MIGRIRRQLARHVDEGRIAAAIQAVEAQSTGKILVTLAPHFWGDVRRAAERAFKRMRLSHAPHRNNILFFVVPSRREFVVLGDAGIHQKVGQDFWHAIAGAVREKIKAEDLTSGLVHGIHTVGKELAQHFPRRPLG